MRAFNVGRRECPDLSFLNGTLSLPPMEQHQPVEVDGLVTGSAAAVPTARKGLQQHHLRQLHSGIGEQKVCAVCALVYGSIQA